MKVNTYGLHVLFDEYVHGQGPYYFTSDPGRQIWIGFSVPGIRVTKAEGPKTLLCRICKRDIDAGRPCWWCGN